MITWDRKLYNPFLITLQGYVMTSGKISFQLLASCYSSHLLSLSLSLSLSHSLSSNTLLHIFENMMQTDINIEVWSTKSICLMENKLVLINICFNYDLSWRQAFISNAVRSKKNNSATHSLHKNIFKVEKHLYLYFITAKQFFTHATSINCCIHYSKYNI